MGTFACWRREVDCEVAFATGGMMSDDVAYPWERAFMRGSSPDEAVRHALHVVTLDLAA